jgi:hypothetical protein
MFPKFAICMIPKVASTSLATFIVNAHQSSNKKNFGKNHFVAGPSKRAKIC